MQDQLTDPAPHRCPECNEPSYLGFSVPARCTNRMCRFFDQDLWVEHIMALPDEEEGVEYEIEEDEDTLPGLYGRFPKVSSWLPAPKDLGPKSAAKQAKVKGGGKLNLPTWADLVDDDGESS